MTSSPPPRFDPPTQPPAGAPQFPPSGAYAGPPQGAGPQQYGGPPPQGPSYGPPQGPSYGPPQGPSYGPPQGPSYGPPQGPPPGSVPPPPPLGAFEQQLGAVPVAAWLVPIAGLLAVVGAFIPWFHGEVTVPGRGSQDFDNSLYSINDGRIGIIPPVILLILGIGVAGLLLGRSPRRFSRGSSHPIVSAARGSMIAGAVTLVCVIIAWFLVPSRYKFEDRAGRDISWNDALSQLHAAGIDASFSRGPQAGYFLTIVAGVLAVVGGALMLVMRSKDDTAAPPAAGSYPPPATGWAAPGTPAPGTPAYGTPAYGTPPSAPQPPASPPAPSWSTPTSYPGGSSSGSSTQQPGATDPEERPNLTK